MKIFTATYLASAARPEQYPPSDLPEVALAGRSNVGKSSLINALVGRRGLAKTSATPGRTQTINFFVINDRLGLVDLPGYGYAQVSAQVRAAWGPMIRAYLAHRPNLKAVVLLLDPRRPPNAQDLELLAWLAEAGRPVVVAATKWDKVKPSQRARTMAGLRSALPSGAPEPLPFSARTGEGRVRLWAALEALLGLKNG